jgi:hypothetical protein
MKKSLLLAYILFTGINFVFSQDYITKSNGDELKVKILEVTVTEVKYKRFEQTDGPIYTILKSEIFMIKYQDGTKDVFSEFDKKKNFISIEDEMADKGKKDARTFYKAKNSGAGWTTLATLLTSPVIGVIPAAICSSNEPEEDNLNAPNTTLMKSYQYSNAYIKEAHKIKRKKIWSSFGVASGVWIFVVALLRA